ncbi:PspA-associated protein PspAA [Methanofollis fontis]|uniref:PspA-associated domain-containing protein n=1 Tax=Methanofollis fontis TaxID=2052832 RepID=A0A483CKQ7_9EURY|nr:hypothetical protein [Methanofollis fontis]TAJ43266.1 hypothetical protein CUJ86_11530 [Methanofollis fontis]
MIIRIIGDGQYHVDSALVDSLNVIDNKIVEFVQNGDEQEYQANLAALIDTIKQHGQVVDDRELIESDIIVPPADMTLNEAREVFSGTGIFEG